MNMREVVAANVRRYRNAAGLTQEELGEMAGLHRTYIGRIEQGGNATLNSIERVADALGVDPAVLLLDGTALPHAEATESDASRDMFALVEWTDSGVDIRPLNARRDDLTIKVLLDLIGRGHRGDDLACAYHDSYEEISRFLDGDGNR